MEGTMMNTSDIISLQMEQSFTRLANVPTAPHTDYAAARQRTIDEMLNSDTSGIYLEIEENKINPKVPLIVLYGILVACLMGRLMGRNRRMPTVSTRHGDERRNVPVHQF